MKNILQYYCISNSLKLFYCIFYLILDSQTKRESEQDFFIRERENYVGVTCSNQFGVTLLVFQVQGTSSKFFLNVCGSQANDDCSSASVCRVYSKDSVHITYKLKNVLSESSAVKIVYVQQPSSAECSLGSLHSVVCLIRYKCKL